jgi:carbonic anhydrase
MMSKIKSDLPASLVVFLVALPLCLGIALASGAPLLSGILSGIIGGIVVGIISESHTSVSGPAAGLAAVVLSAISQLGSFETFLLSVVLAGLIQLTIGIIKGGIIANYIPSDVIKGLLAAIGIILILKQIPHAVGFDRDSQGDFSFNQTDGKNTITELLSIFNYFTWGAIIISISSILIMIYWDKTPLKKIKFFPSSLFVVIFGVVLNTIFHKTVPSIAISIENYVHIPKFSDLNSFIIFPNLNNIGTFQVWGVALTIAIVASIETLLNLEAVENIDPHKRQASPNRELIAQGVGNIFSGLIGGLPITSVIVRGSVNINAGAKSKLSTILHGLFLLISILVLSPVLNLIPLASLASILILTGYKLAKFSLFKEMYKKGLNQFIPFITTLLAIVFTDLLIGVLIGLGVSVFYILKSNFKNPFVIQKQTLHSNEIIRIELPNQVSFLNKASIKETLWSIPKSAKVVIDASHSDFIDDDVLEIITNFKT